MESVKTQDVSVNDLRWTIEYHAERCTMCGSCVAACTFNAIEAGVSHRSVTVSRKAFPEPAAEHFALPVIRQKTRIEPACVGCAPTARSSAAGAAISPRRAPWTPSWWDASAR